MEYNGLRSQIKNDMTTFWGNTAAFNIKKARFWTISFLLMEGKNGYFWNKFD
jgi:hypothetical protein